MDAITAEIKKEQGIIISKASTVHVPISGGDVGGSKGFTAFKKAKQEEGEALGIEKVEVAQLIQLYGSNVDTVFELYAEYKTLAEAENINPVVFAMLQYALRYELAYKPVDFFVRRTGGLFFHYEWVKKHIVTSQTQRD